MKIIKVVETRIDIRDITDMFCSNYDAKFLQILRNLYVRKCFKSIYILEINKIISRSDIHCKNKVLDGSTYIDISFEVTGVIYEKGEIIHNCRIIQINNNGTMHAKSEYASIKIKNVDGLVVVKENDTMPVIVHEHRCNIFEEEISILAIPFIPIVKQPIIYNITGTTKDISHIFDFNLLQNTIKELNSAKTNKTVYKFFTELIYPYKILQKIDFQKKDITLENLNTIASGDLLYSPETYLDCDTVCILTQANKEKILQLPEATILDINKNDYILYVLTDYLRRLQTLQEFLTIYDTRDKIKEKDQIWSLYKLFKK